jgi:DNA processing protein
MIIKHITTSQMPNSLKQLHSVPKVLYTMGDCNLLQKDDRPKIAIVGSRAMTDYGKQVTAKFAAELARAGCIIVSGLAYGIDSQAHVSALNNQAACIAVLPSDVANVYPRANKSLAGHIVQNGGLLISEYPDCLSPAKYQFIERNRLIAALADVIFVPQATIKSGSMHTVNFALELGKTVCTVPASIFDPNYSGNNQLIAKGATPICTIKDLLLCVGLVKKPNFNGEPIFADTPQQLAIIKSLLTGISDEEELADSLGLSYEQLAQDLASLELSGRATSIARGRWIYT